ncbi:MAG: hypothetical protein IKD59_05345 [Lachnospiraceae bacterium]|nr:hypothetical protein [Lachnospiraceae bacterium]
MERSDIAYLIADSYALNDYGVYVKTSQERKVFVSVSSISSTEWFEGSRNGLNPQYRFTMFSHDYQGEKVIEYNGTRYTIYRTFNRTVDKIELYAELKKGNTSTASTDG